MYRGIFFQKELFIGGPFTKKSFYKENFGGNLWERLLYMDELMIRSCQGRGELCKCILQ